MIATEADFITHFVNHIYKRNFDMELINL